MFQSAAVGRTTKICDELTLDQLLAEPIVRQLMRRDRTDEATIRHLLKRTATARWASREDDPGTNDSNSTVRLLRNIAPPGFGRYECAVLTYLAQHEGVDSAGLARILDIGPSTLFRLLDQLEEAGLVVRMPDPEDRRAHVLALTAKALPIIECIYGLMRKTYDDV